MSNRQKKILLHVINSLGRGGAEVLLCNTVALLPEYEHVIVTLSSPHDQLKEIQPFIKAHYCINAANIPQWPQGVIALRKIIRKYQPALVHAHLQIAGVITKLACPRKIPLFYSLHNPYSIDAFAVNRMAKTIELITAKPYHHLIGVSRLALDDYQAHIPRSGTGDIVYNMVGKEFFEAGPPLNYTAGTPLRCVSVGNLKKQKNYHYTLQVMKELRHLPISLDIYGEGYERAVMEDFISKHQLHNVRLMGKVPNIANRLSEYHLYLITSVYEGFGIAPLEGMAVGLPVVATDIEVFREVAGTVMQFVDLNDTRSLTDTLQKVYKGQLDLQPLAIKSRDQAHKIAHPSVYKDALLKVYGAYVMALI